MGAMKVEKYDSKAAERYWQRMDKRAAAMAKR
jgi:hypothetical protein